MVVLLTTGSLEGQHLAKSFFNTGLLGAAGGSVELPSDDQFNRVSFLSHFDGANNGVNNAFDDGSANNYTVTAAGDVTQGSFGPFARPDGEWGVNFDGSGDYLEIADDSSLELGSGNFTIECFFNVKQFDSLRTLASKYKTVDGYRSWRLTFQTNGTLSLDITSDGGGSNISNVSTATVFEENTWYHLALVRNSNTITFYINGTADPNTLSFSATPHDNSTPVRIGTQFNSSGARYYHDGLVSNFRIVVGTALYTGNFTAPTTKLTAVTNTALLTCQSNRFVDNSSSGHTITPSGTAAVSAFGPFLTSSVYDATVNGASAYMDGSGDTLRATWTAADIINQNFTLEYWLYYTQTSGYGTVSIGANDSSASYVHLSYLSSSGQVFSDDGQTSGSGPDTGAGAISPNSWNHLALVRVSNDMFIYINGAKVATKAITASLFQGQSGEFGIGYIANPLEGYICDARIVTSAVYTGATYTVPTAPLTAITNTKLLLNMADGQAIDSAAQNNLSLYGTAKTSTAQYKFGTASLLLDGNSDYATFIENGANDIDGGGNWTVEFFWRFVNKASPTYQEIITKGVGLQIYTNGGSLSLALSSNNSSYDIANATGGTTLDNDVWYHLALVKNGTSYKLYLNGTSEANLAVTSSSNLDTGGFPWFLGTLRTAETTYPSNGYMDEVRISKMARYTSNFTAPTEPFADKGQ